MRESKLIWAVFYLLLKVLRWSFWAVIDGNIGKVCPTWILKTQSAFVRFDMIRIDSASVWLSGGKENPQMLGTRISSSTTTWVGISGSIDMKPSEHVFLLHRSLAHCDERHDMFRDSTIDFYLRIRKQFFVKVLPSQIRSFAIICDHPRRWSLLHIFSSKQGWHNRHGWAVWRCHAKEVGKDMDLEESSNRRIGHVSFVEQVIPLILSFLEDTHSNSPLGSWWDCYVCMSFRLTEQLKVNLKHRRVQHIRIVP